MFLKHKPPGGISRYEKNTVRHAIYEWVNIPLGCLCSMVKNVTLTLLLICAQMKNKRRNEDSEEKVTGNFDSGV
jgi:hypothetical protein